MRRGCARIALEEARYREVRFDHEHVLNGHASLVDFDPQVLPGLVGGRPFGRGHRDVQVVALGNPIENVYVRRVERVNGELQNTVIDTFPRVSQFWKYNPAEYLKQPLYSRRFVPPS